MAASNEPNLRFTTEVPLMESTLNAASGRAALTQSTVRRLGLSVTSVEEMREKISLLLDYALQQGHQDRVERLLGMMAELASIEERVEAHFGRKIAASEIKLGFETTYLDNENYTESGSLSSESSGSDSASESDEDEEKGVGSIVAGAAEFDENAVQECPVCFDEFPRSEMRSFLSCDNHLHCKDCMSDYLEAKIADGEVDKLVCPDLNCDAKPEEYEIESLTTAETYQKYLQFMVLGSINTDKNARWCINKECGQAIVWDPNTKKVVCPACQTEFCFECKAAWHEGTPCNADPEKMADADRQFHDWLSEKGAKVKPCPRCNTPIEKNDGCNRMFKRAKRVEYEY
jgi:IBR domain, a half RING-finger domain